MLLTVKCGQINKPVNDYNYTLIGTVESVIYNNNDEYPCYIAVAVNHNNPRSVYYYASTELENCRFAERCKLAGIFVKIYGKNINGPNIMMTIENAQTGALYWELNCYNSRLKI